MQIYSTKFPVMKEFSKDVFVGLVIEWNQGSPHDKIETLEWAGCEYSVHIKEGMKSLDINDLPEQNVIAAHFRKEDEGGVIWTTDFILNYKENIMSVRLERETTDSTTCFVPGFSPPHIVKMVMRKRYAGVDFGLSVSDEAIPINKKNYEIIRDVINKDTRYMLPIVYVTKNWDGKYPINVRQLSSRLQGVAHVLKETDTDVSKLLMSECKGENVHHGGIGIYYPSVSARDKRINSSRHDGEALIRKIVNVIYRYMNQQIRESMYTWEGIENERLKLKNISLFHDHKKISDENRDLYDLFDSQCKDYEINICSLNNRIEALNQENQGLRAKIDSMEETPLLFYGEEDELYDGEIKNIIMDILCDYLKNQPTNTRRTHIIRDLLDSNDFCNAQKEKHDFIKKNLKGYSTMSNSLRRSLEDFGFSITSDGKHYKLIYCNDSRYVATMSKSSSDGRAGNNLASEIIKGML